MVKKLLLLFSLLLFSGCAIKEEQPKVIYKNICVDYRIRIPKDMTFTIEQKDDKIVLSVKDFKKLLKNYNLMKEELKYIKKTQNNCKRIVDDRK